MSGHCYKCGKQLSINEMDVTQLGDNFSTAVCKNGCISGKVEEPVKPDKSMFRRRNMFRFKLSISLMDMLIGIGAAGLTLLALRKVS